MTGISSPQKKVLPSEPSQAALMPSGFTVAEVLVAIVLIGLGCLGFLAMQDAAMRGGVKADYQTMAMFMATSRLEMLKAKPWDELREGVMIEELTREGISCNEQPGPSACEGLFTRTTRITLGIPTSLSYKVRINVSWHGAFGDQQYVLESYITGFSF